MTHEHDIDHVLDRWFTEGPTQMPQRFLGDTLDRIDRLPPRRFTRLRPAWLVSPALRLAAAAVVVVAVVGIGAGLLIQTGAVGGLLPTGSEGLPASLQAEWHPIGARQHAMRSGTVDLDLDLVIGPTTITVYEFHGDEVDSASVVGGDRLEFRTISSGLVSADATTSRCQIGDEATYTFRLSDSDTHLSLTPVTDMCADRAAVLAGDWTRTDIGNVVPGRRVSAMFKPFDGATSGRLSYDVPSGWGIRTEGDEGVTELTLAKMGPSDGPPGGPAVRLVSSGVLQAAGSPCDGRTAIVDSTPLGFAAWLSSVPGLVVTTPTAVTLGGLTGVRVDLSVQQGWPGCEGAGLAIPTFTWFIDPRRDMGTLILMGDQRARYYLLDAGQGQVLLVALEASDSATLDAALADTTQILDGFEFIR